jgi:hypothetical protein
MTANCQDWLARALWDSGGDRKRARQLAEEALAVYRAEGAPRAAEAEAMAKWLKSR